MKTLAFTKPFNWRALSDEFTAAFPSLVLGRDFDVKTSVPDTILVEVPDNVSPASVQAVITAHDAAAKDKYTLAVERRVLSKTLYTALPWLKGKTPDDVKTYIQNNVTDLASARSVMANMGYALACVCRYLDIED